MVANKADALRFRAHDVDSGNITQEPDFIKPNPEGCASPGQDGPELQLIETKPTSKPKAEEIACHGVKLERADPKFILGQPASAVLDVDKLEPVDIKLEQGYQHLSPDSVKVEPSIGIKPGPASNSLAAGVSLWPVRQSQTSSHVCTADLPEVSLGMSQQAAHWQEQSNTGNVLPTRQCHG